jgi:two-component system, NarL family, sensor kinase
MTTVPAVDPGWSRTVLADRRVPPTNRGQAQEATRRLIAGSLAGLAILVVTGYLVGARLAERQVIIDARHFSALLAHGLVGPQLTPDLLAGDPAAVTRLSRVIDDRLVPRTSLRRVKVWSPAGEILYSDDRREIGAIFPLTDTQRSVFRTGKSVADISDLSEEESTFERGLEPRLLETYTLVHADNGQRALFETYMSYNQIKEQREAVFTTLSLLAAAGVVLFAGFQVGLARINLRWVRRRQSELDEQARVVTDRARQRLARDLHDGTVQELVGTSYVVDGALKAVRRRDLPQAERMLDGAADSVRNSIQSLRTVMIEVYPRTFHERGLPAALADLALPLRTRGIEADVEVSVDGKLSPETSEAVYRGAQEAVRNIMKHARATTVRIRVETAADQVSLQVIDDGIGMPPGFTGSPEGHLGLSALADLAAERRGCLEIWSASGRGTQLRMEMQR